MHSRRLKQMVVDLVAVCHRTDQVRGDVALAVEGLQTAEDAQVLSFFWLGFCVCLFGVGVYPLLYFDYAGAVVDFVGCVCGLGGDGVDLADEGYLGFC